MSSTTYPTIDMGSLIASAMETAGSQHSPVIVTKGGKPAGVVIAFENEDDCFDWQLENDPRLWRILDERMAAAKHEDKLTSNEVRKLLNLEQL